MAFGKKILGAIFETEDAPQTKSATAEQHTFNTTPVHSVVPPTQPPAFVSHFAGSAGTLSDADKEKIVETVNKMFDDMNDPAPSYHEFRHLKESLQDVISGPQLYQSALRALGAQHKTVIDKNFLLNNIQSIATALQTTADEFEQHVQQKLAAESASFNSTMQSVDEELSKLEVRRQELHQQKAALSDSIAKMNVESSAKVAYFKQVVSDHIRVIEADRSALSNL